MTRPHLERLQNFFSAYFHQDWDAEADGAAEVLALYLREGWSAEHLRALSDDIRAYAKTHASDATLEPALLRELGCYYLPSADGLSAHAWLEQVAARLSAAASAFERS